jgi:hypothetical protein
MRFDTIIKQEGFNALKEKLGLVEMEQFIVLINREKSDYTLWRQSLFEDMNIEDLAHAADKYSKSLE